MVNRLSFAPGESSKLGLHYWEPLVDGRPLREILRGTSADEPTNVPVLVHDWPMGISDDVFVLLGERPPELANGRIPIFVCGACGDLGCGATTAAVEWTADTVVWRDFGWDVNYQTDDDEDDDDPEFAGPLIFDRGQYEAELRRFIDTFDEIRASMPGRPLQSPRDDRPRGRLREWWPFTWVARDR
jgi:hypothetical protein